MKLRLFLLALLAMLCIGATSAYAQPTTPPATHGGCTFACGEPEDTDDGECESIECHPQPGCVENCGPVKEDCMINCGDKDPDPCIGPDCNPPGPCVGPNCAPPVADCLVDCGPGGQIPGNKVGLRLCDAQMGDLKKVTAKQIKGVNGRDSVDVVPVCLDKNLIEQQQGVENIRTAIANNKLMDAALDEFGASADHVVGVIVGSRQAVLYVHAL